MTGYGTPSVALATTPTVVSTFFAHLLARRSRNKASKKDIQSGGPGSGPEAQLSYEEGLKVVRRFLDFASHHGVEEVQAFTAMWVPTPGWVKRDAVTVPDINIQDAEDIMSKHLATYGPNGKEGGGLDLVGGGKWWRVRRSPLEGEWIEMQKDYHKRMAKKTTKSPSTPSSPSTPTTTAGKWGSKYLPHRSSTMGSVIDNAGKEVRDDRVILYIHGGAYFFSSLETHRYQVQRHVRKAGARAFSPAYRLSPQYPFPCGLLDCLASYLYLISPPEGSPHSPLLPSNIILMGDSAGGGMVISLLVVIREMGLPMPAGASLISPWVDLTHSMPSIGGWDGGDFIPSAGFHYKPSCAWPPIPGGGIDVEMPDGTMARYDEQVQMYCPNDLMTHPLVSPVNQGSLGGLCPLMILGGGAELLRDEIIYIAHKAAEPTKYLPATATLAQYPDQLAKIKKYKPTKVHLQIYEGCCHVVPTLSWTRSSKYMYRACANFNIWAFNAAQKALQKKLDNKKSHGSLRKERSMPSLSKRLTPTSITGSLLALSTSDASARDVASSPTTSAPPSSSPSPPESSATSRQSTLLDLRQPLINASAAEQANVKPLELSEIQSEAESEDASDSGSGSSSSAEGDTASVRSGGMDKPPVKGVVTVHGSEPLFGKTILVSERVSTHGNIRPFEPIEAIPALQPQLRERIGQVHADGAIQKWLAKRAEWDKKYASEMKKWRKIKTEDRERAEEGGYSTRDLKGENPPMCAVVGVWDEKMAKDVGRSVDEVMAKSAGMGLWTKWGSKADKEHADRQELREVKSRANEETKLQATSSRNETTPLENGKDNKLHRNGFVPNGGLYAEPEEAILEDEDGERRHEAEVEVGVDGVK